MAKDFQRHDRGGRFKKADPGDLGLRSSKERDQRIIDSYRLQQARQKEYDDQYGRAQDKVGENRLKNRTIIQDLETKAWKTRNAAITVRANNEIDALKGQAEEYRKQADFWSDFSTTGAKQLGDLAKGVTAYTAMKIAEEEYRKDFQNPDTITAQVKALAKYTEGEEKDKNKDVDKLNKSGDFTVAEKLNKVSFIAQHRVSLMYARDIESNWPALENQIIEILAKNGTPITAKSVQTQFHQWIKAEFQSRGISYKTQGFLKARSFVNGKAAAISNERNLFDRMRETEKNLSKTSKDFYACTDDECRLNRFNEGKNFSFSGVFPDSKNRPTVAAMADTRLAVQNIASRLLADHPWLSLDEGLQAVYLNVVPKKFQHPSDIKVLEQVWDRKVEADKAQVKTVVQNRHNIVTQDAIKRTALGYEGKDKIDLDTPKGRGIMRSILKQNPDNNELIAAFSLRANYNPDYGDSQGKITQMKKARKEGNHEYYRTLYWQLDPKLRVKFDSEFAEINELNLNGINAQSLKKLGQGLVREVEDTNVLKRPGYKSHSSSAKVVHDFPGYWNYIYSQTNPGDSIRQRISDTNTKVSDHARDGIGIFRRHEKDGLGTIVWSIGAGNSKEQGWTPTLIKDTLSVSSHTSPTGKLNAILNTAYPERGSELSIKGGLIPQDQLEIIMESIRNNEPVEYNNESVNEIASLTNLPKRYIVNKILERQEHLHPKTKKRVRTYPYVKPSQADIAVISADSLNTALNINKLDDQSKLAVGLCSDLLSLTGKLPMKPYINDYWTSIEDATGPITNWLLSNNFKASPTADGGFTTDNMPEAIRKLPETDGVWYDPEYNCFRQKDELGGRK